MRLVLRKPILTFSYYYFAFCEYMAICLAERCQEHGVKELQSLAWQYSGEIASHSHEAHTAFRFLLQP